MTLHAVQGVLKGLFYYLAKEEAGIRQNPGKRTTELLSRVFGDYSVFNLVLIISCCGERFPDQARGRREIASSLIKISFFDLGYIEDSLRLPYKLRALKIYEDLGDRGGIASALHALGGYY